MIRARGPTYHDALQRNVCETTTWAIPSVAKVGGNGIVHPVHVLLFKLLRILLPQSPADKPSITQSHSAAATAVGAPRVHAGARPPRGAGRWRERPHWLPARRNQSVACRAAAAGLRHRGDGAAGLRNKDGVDRERQEQAAQRRQQLPCGHYGHCCAGRPVVCGYVGVAVCFVTNSCESAVVLR